MTEVIGVFLVWISIGTFGPIPIEEYPGTLEGNVLCERSAAHWRLRGFEAECLGQI